MLEVLKAVFLGVVEGITEWLPISSTGHMILVNEFLKLEVSEEFLSLFMVVIQIGAILAVVLLYWHKLVPFELVPDGERIVRKTVRDKSGRKRTKKIRKPVYTAVFDRDVAFLWLKILVSCIPAIVIGLPFDDLFEELFYKPVPIALALIIFGVAFIIVEIFNKKRRPKVKNPMDITIGMAFAIGLFQLLAAIFPGTSRSGATILGGLLLGISRTAAAEFTFYLAIPVMFGASFLKVIKFMLSGTPVMGFEIFLLFVGMLVAFVVSMAVIRFLMKYIRHHDFKIFGYYRIALGLIVLIFSLVSGN